MEIKYVRLLRPVTLDSGRGDGSQAQALKERRQVYFEGAFRGCPVYERELLPRKALIDGPAIIEEYSSTTAIFPGWKASMDNFGDLILERKGV